MAEISLVRVDFRLIHGQVITKWRKVFKLTKCIIVDNNLAKDDFMTKVYVSAAPSDLKVKIYDEDKAVRLWEKNRFGEGSVLLLFNNIEVCYKLAMRGIELPFIQIGGLPSGKERKMITTGVHLNNEEIDILKKLNKEKGIDVFIQTTPEKPKTTLDEIIKILNK